MSSAPSSSKSTSLSSGESPDSSASGLRSWQAAGILLAVAVFGLGLYGLWSVSTEQAGDTAASIRTEKVADLTDTLEQHEIFEPRDVISDEDGAIYVFDNGAKQIHVFDNDFSVQYAFGREGPGPSEFDRAVSNLQFTSDGDLVALEKWGRTVYFFSPKGNYQDSFLIQKEPTTEGTPSDRGLGIPLGMAVDSASNVYLTDRVWYYSRDRVQVFDRSGSFVDGFLPQDDFESYKDVREKHNSIERQQAYVGRKMNEQQRRIAIDNDNRVVVGHRGEYVVEKYTTDFNLQWRTEMEFSSLKPPHAYKTAHMGNEAYDSGMGEGAVADIEVNEANDIFVSVGCFDGSLDEERLDQLSHWIDVFNEDGEHLARLLKDELPPLPARRGYRIDVHGSRLLVLGQTELWAYEIVRESS